MSLINEALKKAQRQRTDAAPVVAPAAPPVGGAPSPRIVKRRAPMPARALMLSLAGGALVLLTGITLTLVLLNLETSPLASARAALAHRKPATPSTPVIVAPAVPTVTLPPVKPIEKVAPPPTPPVPVPVAPVVPPVPEVVVVPPPAPVKPVKPPAPPKPVPNPEVYAFLDTLRISGMRISGTDSKVIMNDRIVRLNDYVNRSLGLRLTGVTASILIFTDEAGLKYTKSLE